MHTLIHVEVPGGEDGTVVWHSDVVGHRDGQPPPLTNLEQRDCSVFFLVYSENPILRTVGVCKIFIWN